ncbi:MAG: diguanylate cyclase [Pseudomonadota bacterium]
MVLKTGFRGGLLLAACAYFVAAKFGMALFAMYPGNITLLWLPSGIGLVMVVMGGLRALPLIFAASFAANFPGMALPQLAVQMIHVAVAAGADTLAPWVGAYMLHRRLPQSLQGLHDLFNFALYVGLLPTLLSALILSLNLVIGGYIQASAFIDYIVMLVLADGLGILAIYPLYMAWKSAPIPSPREFAAFGLSSAAILLFALLAFGQAPFLIFFILPVLLHLAFTRPPLIVTLSLASTVMLLAGLSSFGPGPFSAEGGVNGDTMLIAYLYVTTLIVLGVLLQHRELVSERDRAEAWRDKAGRDPLTGLINRLFLYPMIENEFERASRNEDGYAFALAMVDIDHFKRVNDRYGHVVGDEVLRAVAERINANLRGLDVAARYGGEEFAILFPNSSKSEATQALERLRIGMESAPIIVEGQPPIPITISAGLAAFGPGEPPCTADELITRADQRLYISKRDGRNRITV